MVASIGPLDGSAAAAAPAAPPPQQQQPAAQQPPAAAAAPAPPPPRKAAPKKAAKPAAAAAAGHRTPSIRFPPRHAPSGEQLSALPRERAAALLAQLVAGAGAGAGAGAAAAQRPPVPDQFKNMIAVPIVGGSMPILRGMPVPSGPPGPPRRTMTDAEMEAIMLGGAEP